MPTDTQDATMSETQDSETFDDEPYICAFGGHDENACSTLAATKAYGHWWCYKHESRLDYEYDERIQL